MKSKKQPLTRKKVPINNVTLVTKNPNDKVTEITHKKNMFDLIKKKHKIPFTNKELKNLKSKPQSTYIIEMLFNNGTCKQFVLQTTEPTFQLSNDDKRMYYMYYEECYYDITLKQNRFIYSESFSTPNGLAAAVHVTFGASWFGVSNVSPGAVILQTASAPR